MQTKPNPRYFRQYRNPGQDASGKNGTYGHPITTTLTILIAEDVLYIAHPRLDLHMSKGVFRSLTGKRQTTDLSNLLSCVLLTTNYFVVSNEYASGKCIGVKVYILIKTCSGVEVKVGWNVKTQVKHRYSPKILKYCNFVTIHHWFLY